MCSYISNSFIDTHMRYADRYIYIYIYIHSFVFACAIFSVLYIYTHVSAKYIFAEHVSAEYAFAIYACMNIHVYMYTMVVAVISGC